MNTSLKYKKSKLGFTLIELLVVISVIALLSSIIFAGINTARGKARDAKRLSDIKQLQKALELYYSDNGFYPASNWMYSSQDAWKDGTNALATALAPYLSKLPVDPTNQSSAPTSGGLSYGYFSLNYPQGDNTAGNLNGTGRWYMIVFRLENSTHSIQLTDGSQSCQSTGAHGNGIFHYGNGSNGIVTLGGHCTVTPVNET